MKSTLTEKTKSIYLSLVEAFPLRLIQSDKAATKANQVLRELLLSKPVLNAGERAYVDALTVLIHQYESGRRSAELSHASAREILRFLMEETGMNISDLGRLLGHLPTASQVLSGKRELSKHHIQLLARHFNVSTDLFMGPLSVEPYRAAS